MVGHLAVRTTNKQFSETPFARQIGLTALPDRQHCEEEPRLPLEQADNVLE